MEDYQVKALVEAAEKVREVLARRDQLRSNQWEWEDATDKPMSLPDYNNACAENVGALRAMASSLCIVIEVYCNVSS